MRDLNTGDWKNRKERSVKGCCCGGHNASNAKANTRHHGTRERLHHRQGRQSVWRDRQG